MDFRIVSIKEERTNFLEIELRAVDKTSLAEITARVYNLGEFNGLTIGQVLHFGDNAQERAIPKYIAGADWPLGVVPGR